MERKSIKWDRAASEIEEAALAFLWYTDIRQLLNVWESSVRATHDFLSEEEIIKIREYVPMAIENVEYLIIAEKEFGEPVAFMGIDSNRLEMLFLSPEVR